MKKIILLLVLAPFLSTAQEAGDTLCVVSGEGITIENVMDSATATIHDMRELKQVSSQIEELEQPDRQPLSAELTFQLDDLRNRRDMLDKKIQRRARKKPKN